MINVIVCQMGKPAKTTSVENGTTIHTLLTRYMSIDVTGKTFTVVGSEDGPVVQSANYVLQDGDKLRIVAANAAA